MPEKLGQKLMLGAALLLLTVGAVGTDQLIRWGIAQAARPTPSDGPASPQGAAPAIQMIQPLGAAMAVGAFHLLERSERPPADLP